MPLRIGCLGGTIALALLLSACAPRSTAAIPQPTPSSSSTPHAECGPDDGGQSWRSGTAVISPPMVATASGRNSVQDELLVTAEAIMEIVDPTEGWHNGSSDGVKYGYASMRIDSDKSEFWLYWVGDIPQNIQAILDAAPTSTVIQVRQAKYSLYEMRDALDRVMGGIDHSPRTIDGAFIHGAGPANDGSGLEVLYWSEASVDESRLRLALEDIAKMDVFVQWDCLAVDASM